MPNRFGLPSLAIVNLFASLLFVVLIASRSKANRFSPAQTDKDILDHLLNDNYDRRVLPKSEGPVIVNVSVLLLSLSSPDESSLKYEVEFLMHQHWRDVRLEHDDNSHHEYLNGIHHLEDIWLPDTYFIKHGDFKYPLIPNHIALRIFRDGRVHYTMRRHLILSCQGDLNIFPFDDPFCKFSVESISYEKDMLIYRWMNDTTEGRSLLKSKTLNNLNAYLITNRTVQCDKLSWRGNYSCLQVELVFTRDKAFYFSTVFIPGIILVTSSFITFWLEWNAVPARVMIGVTTMLNFFTTSNGFRSTLPVVSNLTAMNVWDGVCMFFIYASLLEFVCVNYIGRKRPHQNAIYRPGENAVIQRIPAVIQRIGVTLVTPLVTKREEQHADFQSQEANNASSNNTVTCTAELKRRDPPHPIRIAKTIDVISRIVFPIAFACFLIYFFTWYKGI